MEATCPYCKKNIGKIPSRKKRCPICGKDIYVREGLLLTHKEAIFKDAKTKLLGLGLRGVGNAENIDDLWGILNDNVITSLKKGDLDEVSSIYLQMAIICFDEERYKDCIHNYLLCSHFSSIKAVRSSKKYGMGLTFSDLMSRDNYMIASPVIRSIEKLNIPGVDTHNLGVLAITPKLSLDEKDEILREVLDGKTYRLFELDDADYVINQEEDFLAH